MLNGNDIRLLVFSRFEVQKISYLGKGQRRMYVNTFICVCMYIYTSIYASYDFMVEAGTTGLHTAHELSNGSVLRRHGTVPT